jgi:acetyl/propionyl-CoA carboxylase alpha subunit
MLFEIEVNGRTRRVTVERPAGRPHGYRLSIDGEAHDVDAVALDAGRWSLILPDEGGRSVSAGVDERPGGEFDIHLPHIKVSASVDAGRRRRRGGDAASETGEVRVVSPMPGKVLRVLAAVGQDVAARQPLVVVEAMKMENEMSSPRAGRVKEILVTEGLSVEAGRLLAIVE